MVLLLFKFLKMYYFAYTNSHKDLKRDSPDEKSWLNDTMTSFQMQNLTLHPPKVVRMIDRRAVTPYCPWIDRRTCCLRYT